MSDSAFADLRWTDLAPPGHSNTTAILRVQNGGSVQTFSLHVWGGGTNSSATVIVDGPGSSISQATNADLIVGVPATTGGSARLDITRGGTFNNNGTANGILIRDTGTVNVDDATLNATGDVDIEGGSLHVFEGGLVDLSNGAVLTNDGGIVAGSGMIDLGGSTFDNIGTVAPGDSVGTLHIEQGDFVQHRHGTLEIELGGTLASQYDRIIVGAFGAVSLDGLLDVSIEGHYEPQAGDSFEIIQADFGAGVSGTFAAEDLPGHFDWDIDYGNHHVVLQILAAYSEADFDHDGDVDGDDFLAWQSGFGTPSGAKHGDGDANGDGAVNGDDFLIWQSQFGSADGGAAVSAVPEPSGCALLLLAVGLIGWIAPIRRRRH